MNAKNLILAIALLIATIVVAIIKVEIVGCLAYIFLGIMGAIIIADWVSTYIKCRCQTKALNKKEIAKLEHDHQITLSNLESRNKQLTNDNIKLNEQLSTFNHSKYVDIEGFYEWLKLKVNINKDYINKSFSDALSEYEGFKKKLK